MPSPSCLLRRFFVLVSFLACAAAASAQTAYPTGQSLLGDNALDKFTNTNPSQSTLTSVAATGPGFTQAWQLQTTADLTNPWDAQLIRSIPGALAANDVAFIRFYARMTATAQESGGAFLTVYAQGGPPNYDKSLSQEVYLTGDWQEVTLPFSFKTSFPANGASIVFATGYRHQTVQIAALDMVYYGTTVALDSLPQMKATYVGREANAPWRAAANARIEQYRKGDFAIRVLDSTGQPVGNATVSVTMRRHAFQFGSALVMQRLLDDSADSRIYQQKVQELFTSGSCENDLKAPAWQGDWGSGFSPEQTIKGLQWLKDRGIAMRGHVLVWPSWRNSPISITSLHDGGHDDKIPAQILANIASVVDPTQALVTEWDVENEPYDNHDYMDLFGKQIQGDWFVAARQHHPTARLVLNEYANDDIERHATKIASFESNVNYIKSLGAPIGGIGMQCHMGASPTPPANFIATLDRYQANIGLPVRITEFDINTTDEDMQADYLRDFYTAAFSHPSTSGIQMWGFWEKQHWLPNAAMYRADWSEKPAAVAYKKLLFDTWWTKANGSSDTSGAFHGRGFFGDYDVTVTSGGQTVHKTMRLEPGTALTSLDVPLVAARLVNVSTRGTALTGAETMIGGFSVAGAATKTMLVRGIGPALGAYGVPGVLAHPHTKLFHGTDPIAEYDAWDSGASAAKIQAAITAVGAFPLIAGGDSAFLADLAPGSYSVHVVGSDGGTGVASFEAYETSTQGRITNLSTRVFAGTQGGVAIAGFYSIGPTAQWLLIRAIGPGLQRFGLTGTLAKPTVTLRDKNQTIIAANTGWQSSANPAAISAAADATGAFQLNAADADSAILIPLEEGGYSAVIEGADGGTGVCMVEIYVVP